MPPGMRPARLRFAALLAIALAPGCFLDEIDKSMDAYEGNSTKAPAKPGAAPTTATAKAAPGTAAPGAPAAPAGPSWWQTARTLGSDPIDETIAACQIDGRVEFQRRDDCLARGGRPQ